MTAQTRTPELIPDLQTAIRLTRQAGASGGEPYFYSRIVETLTPHVGEPGVAEVVRLAEGADKMLSKIFAVPHIHERLVEVLSAQSRPEP